MVEIMSDSTHERLYPTISQIVVSIGMFQWCGFILPMLEDMVSLQVKMFFLKRCNERSIRNGETFNKLKQDLRKKDLCKYYPQVSFKTRFLKVFGA